MKLPTDLSGQELVRVLLRVGFIVNRQRGSHIILRRDNPYVSRSPRFRSPRGLLNFAGGRLTFAPRAFRLHETKRTFASDSEINFFFCPEFNGLQTFGPETP